MVRFGQKILSRFQIKKPKANVDVPLANRVDIVRLWFRGMQYGDAEVGDADELDKICHVRKTPMKMILAKTIWW